MNWKLAPSLKRLIDQINALAPKRNKESDGTIGDAAHAARQSDHNPRYLDLGKQAGYYVTAADITHDPAGGVDCNELFNSLIDAKDPRLKYIIWNRQIVNARGLNPFEQIKYKGTNPHTHHLHISVWPSNVGVLDTTDWKIKLSPSKPATEPQYRLLKRGMRGDDVKAAQAALKKALNSKLVPDGIFGSKTEYAVKRFQSIHKLKPDGIIGAETRKLLFGE
jgi:hypothetical protein